MKPLSPDASDSALVAFIDAWAALLERQDYEGAFAHTDHIADMKWNAELIREVIEAYGDARRGQKVTVAGVPSDVSQRKNVRRWKEGRHGEVGEIWYDLNIDGVATDLTATFRIVREPTGLKIRLNDIHVM